MDSALGWHTYGGKEDDAFAGGVRREEIRYFIIVKSCSNRIGKRANCREEPRRTMTCSILSRGKSVVGKFFSSTILPLAAGSSMAGERPRQFSTSCEFAKELASWAWRMSG